jgi:hypothetical protein
MFSLAVYLAPMSADTGWSRTGIYIGASGVALGAVAISFTFSARPIEQRLQVA